MCNILSRLLVLSCVVRGRTPGTANREFEWHEFAAKRHCHSAGLYAGSGFHVHAVYFAFFLVFQLESKYTTGQGTRRYTWQLARVVCKHHGSHVTVRRLGLGSRDIQDAAASFGCGPHICANFATSLPKRHAAAILPSMPGPSDLRFWCLIFHSMESASWRFPVAKIA